MGNTEPISAIEFLALDAADTVDVQYVITILTDRIQEQSIVDGHELHIAQLKVRRLMHFV